MKFIYRYRDELIVTMLLFNIILALAILATLEVLQWSWFAENKDALDGASTVLGIIAIAIGALLTYLRFFKGRTFTKRADVQLSVSVHPHGPKKTLHAICLEVHNIGTLPIWNLTPLISVDINGPEGVSSEYDITQWWTPHEDASAEGTISVIDTGETVSFYATHPMSSDAWSVRYIASVKDNRGIVWRAGKTVSNTTEEKDDFRPNNKLQQDEVQNNKVEPADA